MLRRKNFPQQEKTAYRCPLYMLHYSVLYGFSIFGYISTHSFSLVRDGVEQKRGRPSKSVDPLKIESAKKRPTAKQLQVMYISPDNSRLLGVPFLFRNLLVYSTKFNQC